MEDGWVGGWVGGWGERGGWGVERERGGRERACASHRIAPRPPSRPTQRRAPALRRDGFLLLVEESESRKIMVSKNLSMLNLSVKHRNSVFLRESKTGGFTVFLGDPLPGTEGCASAW